MSGAHARTRAALFGAVLSVAACHRVAPTPDASASQDCRAAQAREADTRIHIDGPYMGIPHLGDSLIYIVNDREVWRGVYNPCHPTPGRSAALDHVIPATDSVVSLYYMHGPDVAARYHIGGKAPSAYVIRTAPPPE